MISSKPSSFPELFDDYIGTESCIDLQNEIENSIAKSSDVGNHCNKAKILSTKKNKEKREFPPPIPFLARTQNLASHMPWVLKRHTTSEGRLILREEKVKRHEYFHAHRENGRLTLQLVPLDDDVDGFFLERNEEVESASSATSSHEEVVDSDSDRNEDEDNNVADHDEGLSSVVENENENENGTVVGGASGGSRLKCLDYNSMRSSPSSCILRVPVHPIRTVRG